MTDLLVSVAHDSSGHLDQVLLVDTLELLKDLLVKVTLDLLEGGNVRALPSDELIGNLFLVSKVINSGLGLLGLLSNLFTNSRRQQRSSKDRHYFKRRK